MIQYAAAFDLYFRLSAKRGGYHSLFNKSILFLKGSTARNLMKMVEPLIIAIESTQGDVDDNGGLPIGYIPHHLRVSKLAQKIAEHCRVKPFDRDLGRRPRINTFTYGKDPSSPTLDSEDDTSRYAEPLDGHMQGYLVPTVAQACRPNGQPGRQMPNTTYLSKPDPMRRMRPGQPRVSAKLAERTDTALTPVIFLLCLSSLNGTSRMALQPRIPLQMRNVIGLNVGRNTVALP